MPIIQSIGELFIEIKYNFSSNEKQFSPLNNLDGNRVVITFNKKENTYSNGITMLSNDYIELLIERHPDTYNYSLMLLNNIDIIQDKSISLNNNLYLADKTNKKVSFGYVDSIEYISKIEEDFKRYVRKSKEQNMIAIITGNGVSIPYGAGSWQALTNNLLLYLHPEFIDSAKRIEEALHDSSYSIASFTQHTLKDKGRKDEFYNIIDNSIYVKYKKGTNPTKPSLATIIAEYKHKNKNVPILTYNYDTFIEHEYYGSYGEKLSCYYPDKDYINHLIDGIVHLHGFISFDDNVRVDLVLTDEDYFKQYFGSNNLAAKIQTEILQNYKCIFVGSSMSDIFQMSIINKLCKKSDWECFALMCFETLNNKEKLNILRYFFNKGIKVIAVDNFDDLPIKLSNLLNG